MVVATRKFTGAANSATTVDSQCGLMVNPFMSHVSENAKKTWSFFWITPDDVKNAKNPPVKKVLILTTLIL
jgi:hypothetical protein